LRVFVPATSANLGPGYDCLGLAIGLRNETEVKKSKFMSISVKGEGASFLKTKTNNIFINIFNEKFQELTGEEGAYRFVFNNFIPISRGLGSSSAVIVSAIAAAYEAAGVKCDKASILNSALKYESHPDNITPAVYGGFCSAIVENKIVKKIHAKISRDLKAVVVIPDRTISTKKSRTTLSEMVSHKDAAYNTGRASLLTAALVTQNYDLLRDASKDKLHQTQRMGNMPVLFEVQKEAYYHGALMSTLSGSGSTFFNMAYRQDAKNLKFKLSKKFPKFRVEILDFDNDGLVIK